MEYEYFEDWWNELIVYATSKSVLFLVDTNDKEYYREWHKDGYSPYECLDTEISYIDD